MKKRSISEKFPETDVIKSKKKCPMCAARFPEVILLDLYIHFWQQPPLIGNKLAKLGRCVSSGNVWDKAFIQIFKQNSETFVIGFMEVIVRVMDIILW